MISTFSRIGIIQLFLFSASFSSASDQLIPLSDINASLSKYGLVVSENFRPGAVVTQPKNIDAPILLIIEQNAEVELRHVLTVEYLSELKRKFEGNTLYSPFGEIWIGEDGALHENVHGPSCVIFRKSEDPTEGYSGSSILKFQGRIIESKIIDEDSAGICVERVIGGGSVENERALSEKLKNFSTKWRNAEVEVPIYDSAGAMTEAASKLKKATRSWVFYGHVDWLIESRHMPGRDTFFQASFLSGAKERLGGNN